MARKGTHYIVGLDISLARPGAAVLKVQNGKATVVALSNIRTNTDSNYAERTAQIEHWLHLFLRQNNPKKFTEIGRESFAGSMNAYSIFSAWSGIDRGLHHLGLEDTVPPIGQGTVKKLVTGDGGSSVEKEHVEAAVRKITGYTGEFDCYDESDAVAVAIAIAIRGGYMDEIHTKARPTKRGKTK